MKSETDPITDNEYLLRRVRLKRFRTSDIPIISPNAFEPRTKGRDIDTEGISLYRESCLSNPVDILATVSEERVGEYGIVRIPVACLKSLGLTAHPSPDPLIPGHVVIPELNSTDYSNCKSAFTSIKLELARLASEDGHIVRYPVDPPTSSLSKRL